MATKEPTTVSPPEQRAVLSPDTAPRSFYEAALAESETRLATLQQKIKTIALCRLVSGLAIILSIYKLFRTYGSPAWWMVLCILLIVFIFLLRRSGDLQEAETYQSRRQKINQQELAGFNGQFDFFDAGEGMAGPEHPYAFDLDLFGAKSLFQRLNRSVTTDGKHLLGKYLADPEQDSQKIRRRQSMIAALQKSPGWCQQFLVTGSLNEENTTDKSHIETWLQTRPELYPDRRWKLTLALLPALTLSCWLVFLFGPLPAWPAIGLSLIQLGITGNKAKMISERHLLISKRAGTLKKYHSLIQLFSRQRFQEEGLNGLLAMVSEQEPPEGSFRKLLKLISALDNRLNMIMNIGLNGLLLWDLNCLYRIEKWKSSFKTQFPVWISVSSELDSLISLAVFNFNHPDYVHPVISDKADDQDFTLEIHAGRHPLLYPESSVPNSLEQPAGLNLYLITGANMAGKSTFLRMVGLNMVLAMAGANVAANAMTLTPVALFTSMRTHDSLFTHTSFFHAELKKLQWMMEQIRSGKPVYILLDEILKGTNSRDQHMGSAALIENIIRYKGRGLIATHDIELTKLAEVYPDHIRNIAFEIELKDEQMIFSYQYKAGVCQNMNASLLMKQMGIT